MVKRTLSREKGSSSSLEKPVQNFIVIFGSRVLLLISCLLSKRVTLNCNFSLPRHVGYLFCPSNRFFRSLVGSSVLGAGSSIFCTS